MISLADAQALVLGAISELPVTTVSLREALGLVTAEAIVASEPVPPFANTAMDGYAVRAADTAGAGPDAPVELRVIADLPAGRSPQGIAVAGGEAVRIMTGAPLPEGADAIVMVEQTERAGTDGVRILRAAGAGDHVRAVGGDLEAGQAVFPPGTALSPAHLGVLASLGLREVAVVRRARVAVLSTGDELVESGALAPGQIRDANRPMLLALVASAGAEPVDLGIAPDDEGRIIELLREGIATCDAVVTSGGVSVGDYDYVKAALDRLGALEWWQVAIKPAKPLAFGVVGDTPVFGLPGNPVSSHVSWELFARPAVLALMGHARRFRPEIAAVAEHDLRRKPDGKLHLDRVHVRSEGGHYLAVRTGAQQSNVLSAMAAANGLALLADGDGVAAGDDVTVMLLDAAPDH
ncbi:MAG TPA: gephyrin-like molybdotransferase Glp [Acidimicrobiia bacterium]